MRREWLGLAALAGLMVASGAHAQGLPQPLKVKGGHELGETAEQFFGEGHEKESLDICATTDFKGFRKLTKREAKKFCADLSDMRQRAESGKRVEYKPALDDTELRTDTFTFDGGHLVKVELSYEAPIAENNYGGKPFKEILAGAKEAYGQPTNESTQIVQNAYGLNITLHHEEWSAPHAVLLINEKPMPDAATNVLAYTRAEYDRLMAEPKAKNPLQ